MNLLNKIKSKSLIKLSVLLSIIIFFSVNIITHNMLGSSRIDFTENKLYSLSNGTKSLLENLEEPIHLRLFISSNLIKDVPQFSTYANRVETILKTYSNISNGKITSRDRVAGARFIAANLPSDIIIMDDGMQNPWLKKDITLAVFDGAVGLGNGRILPAGPLRQSLKSALPSMDMAVINGGDKTGLKQRLPQKLTCLSPRLLPNPETADEIKQRSLLAFAGIGRPQGFFDTLEACGAVLVKTLPFADHHPYSEADLTRLYLEATQLGAELITTQKDWVRLPPEWRERIFVLDVSLMLDDDDAEQLMQTLAPYLHKEKG